MLCSDTFPTMPIKHLRRGYFVTRLKRIICYPLIFNIKHRGVENFHHNVLPWRGPALEPFPCFRTAHHSRLAGVHGELKKCNRHGSPQRAGIRGDDFS